MIARTPSLSVQRELIRQPGRFYPEGAPASASLIHTGNGLLVSDHHPQDAAGFAGALIVPPGAAPYVARLRAALDRHRMGGAPEELETAFGAARVLLAALAPSAPGGRPDLDELRRLADQVPELGAFLSVAAGEAERLVRTATVRLWQALGLRTTPPAWSAAEHAAARMLFACACAPTQEADPTRLRTGLRALAAPRFAEALCAELSREEAAWPLALGDRYASVRHRCAPRTAWRSRGLSDLLRDDERTREAVTVRLERWLSGGGALPALAAELEAALVHARTPPRFA